MNHHSSRAPPLKSQNEHGSCYMRVIVAAEAAEAMGVDSICSKVSLCQPCAGCVSGCVEREARPHSASMLEARLLLRMMRLAPLCLATLWLTLTSATTALASNRTAQPGVPQIRPEGSREWCLGRSGVRAAGCPRLACRRALHVMIRQTSRASGVLVFPSRAWKGRPLHLRPLDAVEYAWLLRDLQPFSRVADLHSTRWCTEAPHLRPIGA